MAQDAVELIKSDHRTVEQLFREFEQAGERAHKTKQRLVEQITQELGSRSGSRFRRLAGLVGVDGR